ncbi:MAG: hypothetical protein EA362_05115 [Saprospirales bacterium]|nr:MAG: hypothetical protein EA362_05115 [Saprospirales bacterium]
MIRLAFIAIVIFGIFTEGNTQSEICNEWTLEERRELAVKWIDAIAEKGLVVVMESNSRQINYLESQLKTAKIEKSERRKKRTQKQLEELRTTTREKAEETIEAFNKYFEFSDVYFLWDYNIRDVIQQSDAAVFLADDLTYMDSSPFDATDEVYFLIRGRADRSSGRSGMEGFLIRNKELNPLCTPFPFFLARNQNNFFNAIFSIFSPELYTERPMNQVADRFNSRLKGF